MKDNIKQYKQNNEDEYENKSFEFSLQKKRINRILVDTIQKLKLLSHLSHLLENDGEILQKFLNKTDADFVVLVCQEQTPFSKHMVEDRSDLMHICNMLERINMYEKKESMSMKKGKSFFGAENLDTYVSYAVDKIFSCRPLVEYMRSLNEQPNSLMAAFIESMIQLQKIVEDRLSISAVEEIQKENDLKTAYRSSMMLSENIQELEEQLEKQRQELGREHDRKEAILQDLAEKIEQLKNKSKKDINKIVYESEILMMKDYNKSVERQEELSQDANETTRQYESLLEEHLAKEKTLRARRLKVETQLASWVAKYDTDIGEKQAEFEELEKTYNEEKEEFDQLQEQFEEQQEEYNILMREKEDEERRIYEEKAWIFLQNRSARRIQRYWRAYKARKLAKKKARKSKKKSEKPGSAGSKKEKKSPKDKKKSKKEKTVVSSSSAPDPNALLENQFRGSILGEIKSKEAFDKKDVVVDLIND